MRRREFIVGSAAVGWPLSASAQPLSSTVRIGILATANPRSAPFVQAFEQRLGELGYADGQNIVIDYRSADGNIDRLPTLAAELVARDVRVIITATDPATRAAMAATPKVPIIMMAINYDPIALGYIDSMARPGRNVTGIIFQHLELLAKRFGLLMEMLPSITRLGVLSDAFTADQFKTVEATNRQIGLELHLLALADPPYDFGGAFRRAATSGAEAIFALESAFIFRGRAEIVQLASEHRLPTSFAFRDYVEAGGLCSYGVNFSSMYRRAAEYADKILRGAKPSDLPVELSTTFELAFNLKAAKALGVTIAPNLLARADEVIE